MNSEPQHCFTLECAISMEGTADLITGEKCVCFSFRLIRCVLNSLVLSRYRAPDTAFAFLPESVEEDA
jgi:hypothetical protein